MRVVMGAYRRPDGKRRKIRQTLGREWVQVEVLTAKATVRMAAKRWSGYFVWEWLSSQGRRSLWPSGWSYQEVVQMKRKTKTEASILLTAQASRESKLLGQFPHLIEHLTAKMYDDNTSRQPGTVTIGTVGSMFRVTAREPDADMQLPAIMPSLDDALVQLELLLGMDEAPWEPKPQWGGKAPKNSKK